MSLADNPEIRRNYNKIYDNVKENKDRRNFLRRERRKKNKDKERELKRKYSLKRIYGITEKDYNELLESQNNCCAICGTFDPKGNSKYKKFHIDHDHSNGMIRGLLCCKCNRGLGLLGDSIEFIQKVISYLEKSDSCNFEPFVWQF